MSPPAPPFAGAGRPSGSPGGRTFGRVTELRSVHGNAFARDRGVLDLRRILVPVDFTETSDRALEYAIELARRFDAGVTIMHAYQIPVYGLPDLAYVTTAELATQISTAAQQRLDAILEGHKASGI